MTFIDILVRIAEENERNKYMYIIPPCAVELGTLEMSARVCTVYVCIRESRLFITSRIALIRLSRAPCQIIAENIYVWQTTTTMEKKWGDEGWRTSESRADDISTRQKVRWRNYDCRPCTRAQMDNCMEMGKHAHTHTQRRSRTIKNILFAEVVVVVANFHHYYFSRARNAEWKQSAKLISTRTYYGMPVVLSLIFLWFYSLFFFHFLLHSLRR